MQNTKLIKLLRTFSKQEIIRFSEFVSSPFFNKNKNLMKVNEEILKQFPEFNPEKLDEEKIYSKIFKNEKYNYFKLKNYISDLYQLALLFLKNISYEEKAVSGELNLLNQLHERKLDNLYEQKEKQIGNQMKSFLKDEFYYDNQYKLARLNTSHFKFEKSGYTFDLIQNEFDVFLKYCLVSLLRHYSKMLTNKNHGNINFNLEMFDNVWDYVKDKEFKESPSSQLYKQIISLELSKSEKDYDELISFKEKNEKHLSLEDIYFMLLSANSFAAYKLKTGDEKYYRHRFKIFKEMTEKIILPRHYTLFINFISAYTSAIMSDEFDWADKYMNDFQSGISPPDERTNTINYCKGYREYRLKNYGNALEYFAKTNFKLFIMKVMVKSYTIRIYYEQQHYEQVFSAIDSFRHYLKNENQIDENQKTAHYEFLKLLSDLTKLKLDYSSARQNPELSFLKKQIDSMSSNPLGAKNWLLRKADEF